MLNIKICKFAKLQETQIQSGENYLGDNGLNHHHHSQGYSFHFKDHEDAVPKLFYIVVDCHDCVEKN